jgi:hypothetical protein
MLYNLDEVREDLRRMLSSPMRENLSTIGADTALLLYLDPFTNEIRVISLDSRPDDVEKALSLQAELDVAKELSRLENTDNPRAYFYNLIFELAENSGLSNQDFYAAAVYLVQSQTLPLGNYFTSSVDDLITVDHWSWKGQKRPLIRFQDAIDWAAIYNFNLDSLKKDRPDTYDYEQLTTKVLKIPRTAEIPRIVTQDNFYFFLAEHILSLGPEWTLNTVRHLVRAIPSFAFYFWPLQGLGQWRAGVLWISRVGDQIAAENLPRVLATETSSLAQSTLTELFSLLLLNTFTVLLRQSLSSGLRNSDLPQMIRAFPLLWWSSQITFFKNHRFVQHIERDTDGKLLSNKLPRNQPAFPLTSTIPSGFFEMGIDRNDQETIIRLRLQNLVSSESKKDDKQTLNFWPFDDIYFKVRLFGDTSAHVRRWAEQLEQRLGKVIEDNTLQRRATYEVRVRESEQVYEGLGHMLKGSVSLTGWADALDALITDYPDEQSMSTTLKKVKRSLSLLAILEGSAGLLRLVGILNRKEYNKLTYWFTRNKSSWNEPSLLDDYTTSLTHLARAIGSALGYPFLQVKIGSNPPQVYTNPVTFKIKHLHFPPLSKERGPDAIFALLPAFIEPYINAIRYVRDTEEVQERKKNDPVKLYIEDRRNSNRSHIFVKILNFCPTKPPAHQTGLRITKKLMQKTMLATIIDGYFEQDQWAVGIQLHPQKLHHFLNSKKVDFWQV